MLPHPALADAADCFRRILALQERMDLYTDEVSLETVRLAKAGILALERVSPSKL